MASRSKVFRRCFPIQSQQKTSNADLRRTISFSALGELFAGSFGCGNDFVEALITAQRIPARIALEIAVGWAGWDFCDNFELLERAVGALESGFTVEPCATINNPARSFTVTISNGKSKRATACWQ